jgi:hypothetical protein
VGYDAIMFEQITLADAMKWIVLVFAAGFIGFFGKHLGRAVISLFHRDKASTPPEPIQQGSSPAAGPFENELKIIKKAMKAKAKAEKKLGK